MASFTPEQLTQVIREHSLWIGSGHREGCRANLSGANLSGANLSGANLSWANLSWANLIGANLIGADLSGADLSGANLIGAYLIGANLRGAHLIGANLSGANLSGAGLRGANLRRADLSGANLIGANLIGADLIGADLIGADLSGAILNNSLWTEAQTPFPIWNFQLGKHLAVATPTHLCIGCKSFTWEEWETRVEEIGRGATYSPREIARYIAFIQVARKEMQEETKALAPDADK